MRAEIEKYFENAKIESFVALKYEDMKVLSPDIMGREDFVPRSVILFLIPYYSGECGNLSRYAVSYDYHLIIKEIGDGLIEVLRGLYPEAHFRTYGDHSPIDERYAALVGGLGLLGDNGLFINEKYGSYVFIADVISDVSPEEIGAVSPKVISGCLHCEKCKSACPTGILRGEGTDCLSAITQRKGDLTDAEIDLMKQYNTVWGCDECQCHCPYNENPKMTPLPFFYEDRIDTLTSEILSGMSKEEFSRRAFGWRGRKVVERNLKSLNY